MSDHAFARLVAAIIVPLNLIKEFPELLILFHLKTSLKKFESYVVGMS